MVPEPTGPPSPRAASRERRSDSRDGCSREERRRMDGLDRPAGPEEERKDDKEPERSSGQRRRKHRERKEEQAARSRTRGREKTRQEEHREHRRSDSDVSSGSRPHVDTTSWRRCHVCHQDVGGGTMIFSTISRITKNTGLTSTTPMASRGTKLSRGLPKSLATSPAVAKHGLWPQRGAQTPAAAALHRNAPLEWSCKSPVAKASAGRVRNAPQRRILRELL